MELLFRRDMYETLTYKTRIRGNIELTVSNGEKLIIDMNYLYNRIKRDIVEELHKRIVNEIYESVLKYAPDVNLVVFLSIKLVRYSGEVKKNLKFILEQLNHNPFVKLHLLLDDGDLLELRIGKTDILPIYLDVDNLSKNCPIFKNLLTKNFMLLLDSPYPLGDSIDINIDIMDIKIGSQIQNINVSYAVTFYLFFANYPGIKDYSKTFNVEDIL